jgi:glycosyltransferase involved in cell wall biosynthesis
MVREDGENLVFILSLPRSGSTLLSAVLGGHGRVCCPPEPWFLLRLAQVGGDASSDRIFDDYFASVGTRSFLPGEAFLESARAFALKAYNSRLEKEGKDIFVDKTPRHYHILEFIDGLFPRAKKIWLKRDPLDVAASYLNSWGIGVDVLTGDSALPASFDFTSGLAAYRKYFADTSPVKYVVRYEDIVKEPEETVRGICGFLGVPFEEGSLRYSENSSLMASYGGADVGDRFVLQQSRLHAKSIGRWREAFSKEDLGRLMGVIGFDALREMGYAETADELVRSGVEAVPPAVDGAALVETLKKTSYGVLYNNFRDLKKQFSKMEAEYASLGAEFERQGRLKANLECLPIVSVVTPVYNGAKWIEACIKSVMAQDYPRIEHIIVDGGSTDGTLDICAMYPHLRVHAGKDRGQSHAINKGFGMAKGDVLAWLCADDEYEPGAVSAAVRALTRGARVVMGWTRYIDSEGRLTGGHPANSPFYFDHKMLLKFWKHGTISQPATFWWRQVWERSGPVREDLYFAMDYDLWMRMSRQADFIRVPQYFARYRVHPEAKCFADNYGSRVELIKVSMRYWPPVWRPGFWALLLSYASSKSPITRHYADGARLLAETARGLDAGKRVQPILSFASAHLRHPATPWLPRYRNILRRVIRDAVGPAWLWRGLKRTFGLLKGEGR